MATLAPILVGVLRFVLKALDLFDVHLFAARRRTLSSSAPSARGVVVPFSSPLANTRRSSHSRAPMAIDSGNVRDEQWRPPTNRRGGILRYAWSVLGRLSWLDGCRFSRPFPLRFLPASGPHLYAARCRRGRSHAPSPAHRRGMLGFRQFLLRGLWSRKTTPGGRAAVSRPCHIVPRRCHPFLV